MTYFEHLRINWAVARKAAHLAAVQSVMVVFHFAHGIFPWSITSHSWWGFYPHQDE